METAPAAIIMELALWLLCTILFASSSASSLPDGFSFKPTLSELVGAITIFLFLLDMRIADDFKDEETDTRLFPSRPYPSGRIQKKDMIVLLCVSTGIIIIINVALSSFETLVWLCALFAYFTLMSFWFFQKKKIQTNLILALVTHNPCMLLLNYYAISITCSRLGIDIFTLPILCFALMLYLPALEYEISRKIRRPADETAYVTYSKILGVRKAVALLLFVSLIELSVTLYISWALLSKPSCIAFAFLYCVYLAFGVKFVKKCEGDGEAAISKYSHISNVAKCYIFAMQSLLIIVSIVAAVSRFYL